MIRVVLDTNIIVSALLQPLGPPSQIFVLAIGGSIQLCISGSVYAEYDWRYRYFDTPSPST
jgi:uncharacterized protein